VTQPFYRYPGATNANVYELENTLVDPAGRLEAHMEALAPMAGKTVLDIGAGGGFHAVRFAARAARVFAVEPDPNMRAQLFARLAAPDAPAEVLERVSVIAAGAEDIPLAEGIIDVAHARFAYFFGTEAMLPGIRLLRRLLAPDGHAFLIDNYTHTGLFGQICRAIYPKWSSAEAQDRALALYAAEGFSLTVVESAWEAPDRDTLRTVVAMEFPEHIDAVMDQVEGTVIPYHFAVHHYSPKTP